MKLARRQFLHLAAAAAALPALSRVARAQSYPTRQVHLLEGFGAGGAVDVVARLIGQSLSERLGQPFVIENRSGATGSIATEAVVRASPDGYTLLLATTSNAINATMLKLNFDFIRDIAPIAGIVRVPLVMEVHPSVPAKSVAEFIAYAKANPGKVNMASAGTGGLPHAAGEMFKTMAGVDLFHVPYRGAQVFPALLTGEAQVYFGYSHRSNMSGPAISAPWRQRRWRARRYCRTFQLWAKPCPVTRQVHGSALAVQSARRSHRKTEQGS
jgi:tripartite-type tricarboxylate transporter receptor subunit TctC